MKVSQKALERAKTRPQTVQRLRQSQGHSVPHAAENVSVPPPISYTQPETVLHVPSPAQKTQTGVGIKNKSNQAHESAQGNAIQTSDTVSAGTTYPEYFAMGVHDTFNHPEFKKLLADTLMPTVEPFIYFPMMQSLYCFARDPKRYGEMIFVNRLLFKSYMDFFVYDLLNGMHHGHAPSKCECCGKYFLTLDAHRPKYCNGMALQNPHYTCRQYGAMNQQKEKNANHPVFQIFKTRTSTIRKYHQRGKITDAERREAMKVCEELRDRALFDTEFAQGEYIRLMEQDSVYAEVSRRLGGGPHDK